MSLPESKQDAALAGTYEARPGAGDAVPAGVSPTSNETLSSSVKSSLDKIADSGSAPPTQPLAEQLPSAQAAADAVKAGASSLIAGVSNLALGVNNFVAQNASASHSESDNARKIDDLHVPGAFEDNTSDTEDKAAIKQGLQSAYDTLPSKQAVQNSLPDTEAVSRQLPTLGSNNASEQLPGQQTFSKDAKIHQEGIDHIKEQLSGETKDSVGASPQQGQIHQDGIDHIKRQLHGQHISSAGANSTTSHLAGQVPLEPRGVPQIVSASQRQAGLSPEAASNPEAVHDKSQLEQELKRAVPESTTSSSGLTGTSAGQDRGVPHLVADSQKKADVSPEASANAEAVHVKQQVERELKREVSQQSGVDSTPVVLGEAVSEGLVSAGAAIAGAATYARQKAQEATGTDPVALLPESAQQAIDGQVTSSSHSGPQPQTLFENQPPRSSGQGIKGSLEEGVSAAGSAAAGAATYARQKAQEATGTDPVSVLPTSAQQAIDGNATSSTSFHGVSRGNQQPGQSLTDSLSAGASSAGSAAADAANYAREKTHEATGTDPVSLLPPSVQKNIDRNTTDRTESSHSHTSNAPYPRVVGEPVVGGHSHASDVSFPRVVSEPSVGGQSGGVDLQAGVHNGVVGDHLDDDAKSSARSVSGSHSGHWQPGSSATVAHIPSLRDVDLSAGVKNTVVGTGAEPSSDVPQ